MVPVAAVVDGNNRGQTIVQKVDKNIDNYQENKPRKKTSRKRKK